MAVTIFHKVTNKVTIINKESENQEPQKTVNARISDKAHKIRKVARR